MPHKPSFRCIGFGISSHTQRKNRRKLISAAFLLGSICSLISLLNEQRGSLQIFIYRCVGNARKR